MDACVLELLRVARRLENEARSALDEALRLAGESTGAQGPAGSE